MRDSRWTIAIAGLAASPALGQAASSMSANSGTSLVDSEATNVARVARAIDEQHAAKASRAQAESLAYQENLRVRRQQAEQYAAAARSGVALPADAAETLRRELQTDIEQWRAEFAVDRHESKAMRDRWLGPRDSLTGMEWAQRRVEWWAARDAWVAGHRH